MHNLKKGKSIHMTNAGHNKDLKREHTEDNGNPEMVVGRHFQWKRNTGFYEKA